MPATFFKRTLTWSIPAALITLAIEYLWSGKMSAYVVAVNLVVFVIMGIVSAAFDSWLKRKIAGRTSALRAAAVFWAIVAIGLFVFFYRNS